MKSFNSIHGHYTIKWRFKSSFWIWRWQHSNCGTLKPVITRVVRELSELQHCGDDVGRLNNIPSRHCRRDQSIGFLYKSFPWLWISHGSQWEYWRRRKWKDRSQRNFDWVVNLRRRKPVENQKSWKSNLEDGINHFNSLRRN